MSITSFDHIAQQDTANLRSRARRIRCDMPPVKVQRNYRLLAQYFWASPIYQKSRCIAFYYPVNNEAGSINLINQALRDGKKCFLPVINRTDHSMKFIRVGAGTVLKKNGYGIPEPTGRCSTSLVQLDLLLIPLLGFDDHGSRIGMGGGYYDRALEFTRRDQYYRRPRLIGLAHENQKLTSIKPQAWDIPLDGVFTESGFRTFTNKN
ncbi:MAG TPA: 5-formyltetrahydrofolate cyclo-ligase [Gammaproteobacteria bacterium]|nr:5-formyltetrahydrofolate cyclo-ligase [Gammaproteobacteria bacterium]